MGGTSLDVFELFSDFYFLGKFHHDLLATLDSQRSHCKTTTQNGKSKKRIFKKNSGFCNVTTDKEDFWNCGSET